jgi:hypothetical protein
MQSTINIYEVRPRKDHRGFDLVSDVLPFGRLWYDGPNAISNAIGYAEHRSRSHDSVIRVYDDRHARAQGRFQGVVGLDSFTDCSVPLVVRLASIARENYTRR